jgi:hypothetical protein
MHLWGYDGQPMTNIALVHRDLEPFDAGQFAQAFFEE